MLKPLIFQGCLTRIGAAALLCSGPFLELHYTLDRIGLLPLGPTLSCVDLSNWLHTNKSPSGAGPRLLPSSRMAKVTALSLEGYLLRRALHWVGHHESPRPYVSSWHPAARGPRLLRSIHGRLSVCFQTQPPFMLNVVAKRITEASTGRPW